MVYSSYSNSRVDGVHRLQTNISLMRSMKYLRVLFAGTSLLILSGCGEQELYSGLSESQANDMVALMYSAGMPASKIRDTGGEFSVMTDKSSFASAVGLLHANGLPRASYENLGEVFSKEGFVSSPLEERARLNYAMSQEIAHTISSIDGVLVARVHLAVPEGNELSDKVKPASASVFIKHRVDADLSSSVSRIKALVINGIENLSYDKVTVALFKADQPMEQPVVQKASELQATAMPVSMATIRGLDVQGLRYSLVVLLLLGLGAVLWWGLTRRRQTADTVQNASSAKVADFLIGQRKIP